MTPENLGGERKFFGRVSNPEATVRLRRARRPEEVAESQGRQGMPRYLISFNDGWMDFPEEDFPAVAKAASELVREARDAGVWVYGAGLESQRASIVAPDGMVTDGPFPETKEVIGGFCVVDVPSREEALEWAVKTAAACRCPQEVREILPDPPGLEQDVARAVGAST
jgi:hypothetical protein